MSRAVNAYKRFAAHGLVFTALVLGFAVADLSNIRWLGGLIMVVIGGFAAWYMWRSCGPRKTLVALGVVILGFIVSHPLGAILGSYGALFLVSIVVAGIVWILGSPQGNGRRKTGRRV